MDFFWEHGRLVRRPEGHFQAPKTGDSNSTVPKLIWVSWIGHADLKAAEGEAGAGIGPIAQAVAFKDFARIVLLGDSPADRAQRYLEWLKARTRAALDLRPCTLSPNPVLRPCWMSSCPG
jgi:hypothetical protein